MADDARKQQRWMKLLGLGARPRPNVGATPADVVHRDNKLRLLRYRPRREGLVGGSPTKDAQFQLSNFAQMLHTRRDALALRLTHRIERKVLLHKHFGFHEVDVNPLVEDLLRLIPGLVLVETDFSAPGHMCSALSRVPASLKDVTRTLCDEAVNTKADTVATVFHSCQRLLCALEGSEPFKVVNYVNLLTESMGLEFRDDYKEWKLAGSEEAVIAKVGEERIAAMGEKLFRDSILPELLRQPSK